MNAIWILLVFVQFNIPVENTTNKLMSQEFYSKEQCMKAGNEVKKLIGNNAKKINFTCLKK